MRVDDALTRSGTVTGTPAYMAPEQLDGRASDAAADQYAWCVSLYEALAGRRPVQAAALPELLAKTTAGELDKLPRDVPGWLTAVVRVRGGPP